MRHFSMLRTVTLSFTDLLKLFVDTMLRITGFQLKFYIHRIWSVGTMRGITGAVFLLRFKKRKKLK